MATENVGNLGRLASYQPISTTNKMGGKGSISINTGEAKSGTAGTFISHNLRAGDINKALVAKGLRIKPGSLTQISGGRWMGELIPSKDASLSATHKGIRDLRANEEDVFGPSTTSEEKADIAAWRKQMGLDHPKSTPQHKKPATQEDAADIADWRKKMGLPQEEASPGPKLAQAPKGGIKDLRYEEL